MASLRYERRPETDVHIYIYIYRYRCICEKTCTHTLLYIYIYLYIICIYIYRVYNTLYNTIRYYTILYYTLISYHIICFFSKVHSNFSTTDSMLYVYTYEIFIICYTTRYMRHDRFYMVSSMIIYVYVYMHVLIFTCMSIIVCNTVLKEAIRWEPFPAKASRAAGELLAANVSVASYHVSQLLQLPAARTNFPCLLGALARLSWRQQYPNFATLQRPPPDLEAFRESQNFCGSSVRGLAVSGFVPLVAYASSCGRTAAHSVKTVLHLRFLLLLAAAVAGLCFPTKHFT